MTRFSADQLAYARSRSGYLDRQASIEFLKTHEDQDERRPLVGRRLLRPVRSSRVSLRRPAFRATSKAQCRRTKAAGVDAIEIHQSVFEKIAQRRPRLRRRSSARRTGSSPNSG